MDVFSHFAVPFLLVYLLSRDRRAGLAAGVGGVAPDLDSVTFPLAYWDPLYFLGHRGVSHSFLGAPLFALAFVLLLRAPFWRRILPVAGEVRFGAPHAAVAMAFSYTHLLGDWLTGWGVPLLYPWSAERFSAGFFFYSVTAMVPTSAYLVWRIARATDTRRARVACGALLLAAIVVASGVRAATFPRDERFDVVHPAATEWSWNALERTDGGWRATFYSWGREVGSAEYVEIAPPGAAARDALDRARSHVEHRAFVLYGAGPQLAQVEARDDGGWNVTFLDLHERAQADRAPWFPFADEAGILRLAVHPDGTIEEIDP